jgi:hypothetical protein
MPKLHELLAVEGDLKSRAQQAKNAITKLFVDGSGRFVGRVITYQVDEGEDPRPPEITELGTTVDEEIGSLEGVYGAWLDVAIQKEVTNQGTAANIVIDGQEILNQTLPAPALLNLEAKLTELRMIYAAIPILDPSERWEWNEDRGQFISADRVTNITKKVPQKLTLAEATEHHPAQVQAYHEDVKIGTRTTTLYSGMISPRQKTVILDRLDKLIRAVKEARQRANDIEINDVKVSAAIFDYLRE